MKKLDLDNGMSPELGAQVHEAFSRLARRLRALDLPYALTNERLSSLATIAAREPISVSALAEAEIVSLPTMSRMVAKLDEEGFVRRREDKRDSRSVLVSTTAKGRRAYLRATQQSLTHLKETLGTLKPGQLAAIHALLSSLAKPKHVARTSELERLYAIAPVGLCYFDTELRYLYINEWLARINGLPLEAHLGKPIDEVLPHVAIGAVPELRKVLNTGKPLIDGLIETETPAHPGESRRYLHSYYADKRKDGTIIGVNCVVQDVTGRVSDSQKK